MGEQSSAGQGELVGLKGGFGTNAHVVHFSLYFFLVSIFNLEIPNQIKIFYFKHKCIHQNPSTICNKFIYFNIYIFFINLSI